MIRLLVTTLCLAMTLGWGLAPEAHADKRVRSGSIELDLHFGGYFFLGEDEGVKDTFSYGVGAGFNFNRNFGAQFDFEMAPREVNDRSFYQFHVNLVYHPISHKWFIPFIGIGPSFVLDVPKDGAVDADPGFNVVAGFDIYPFKHVGFRAQARYVARFASDEGEVMGHDLLALFGLVVEFGGKKKKKAPVLLDTDGDGLLDRDDACPKIPGVQSAKGCPDADGDTITDKQDSCPKTPGPVKYAGCPDTDGDTVIDVKDRCPKKPGVVALKGCPDIDKDTVADRDDRCPKIPGDPKFKGCPPPPPEVVVQTFSGRMDGISFKKDSHEIREKSFPVLDKAVAILKQYPHVRVLIEGHTSSEGDAAYNRKLSDRRAKSVRAYLISKDIAADRLEWKGFGPDRPVADNKTKKGRKLNRRIEFRILRK